MKQHPLDEFDDSIDSGLSKLMCFAGAGIVVMIIVVGYAVWRLMQMI